MKYAKTAAVLLLLSAGVLGGCSPEEPHKTPLESFPIVVASQAVPSGVSGHSHNCDDPATLCGTISNGVFEDTQHTFRLSVPEGWVIREQELTHDLMILGAPDDRTSIEIRRQDSDPNLLAYTQAEFEESYRQGVSDFRMTTFEKVSIHQDSAVHLVYEYTTEDTAYQFDQYVIAGDRDYNISLIRRAGDPDHSAEFTASAQSFQRLSTQASNHNGRLVGTLYTSPDAGYSISLPEGWRLDPEDQDEDHLAAWDAGHSASLHLLVGEPDTSLTNSTQEQFQQQYAAKLPALQITLFEKVTLSGCPALHIVCSYQDNGKTICAEQFLVSCSKHTYSLTFSKAGAAAPDPLFAAAANSFQGT